MPAMNLRVGAVYRSGGKYMQRRVEQLPYVTGIYYVTYIECGYTVKDGWYTIGKPKTVLRTTFYTWITSEIKEVKNNA